MPAAADMDALVQGVDAQRSLSYLSKPEGGRGDQTRIQEAVLPRATGTTRGAATSASGLTPAQRAKWCAAAVAATRQLRALRASTDHSTFAALNMDGVRSARGFGPKAGLATPSLASLKSLRPKCRGDEVAAESQELRPVPQKQWQAPPPDSEAETGSEISFKEGAGTISLASQGRDVSATLSSANSGSGDDIQAASSDFEEAAQAEVFEEEEEEGEQGGADLAGLGIFFKSSKARPVRARAGKSSAVDAAEDQLGEATEQEEAAEHVPASSCDSAEPCAKAYPRGTLLAFRRLVARAAPEELAGLSAQVPEEPVVVSLALHLSPARQTSMPASCGLPSRQVSAPSMDLCGLSHMTRQTSAPVPMAERRQERGRAGSYASAPLTPSASAYRAGAGTKSPMDELRRAVKCLLNKVCPESVETIASRISAISVQSAEELQEVIYLVFQKALSEPHYCATYADLVFRIKSAFPDFPSAGAKPHTFKSLLLDVCQREFESLPTTLEPTNDEVQQYDAEELEHRRKRTKDRLIANMKLIGHLFLRQMLSPRVLGAVIAELTLCRGEHSDRLPEGHCVECAVELLLSVGHALEQLPIGQQAITQVCGRLLELQQRRGADGRGAYCKRIQFAIQDLLDVRSAGWARKVFNGVARTKEEIRQEQERDLISQKRGKDVLSGQVIISGQRPEYIEAARTVC